MIASNIPRGKSLQIYYLRFKKENPREFSRNETIAKQVKSQKSKMEKQCLECNEKIVGRTDKKFCSDACRNAYNNRVNKDSKNLIRNTNNRLRKNYRILETLNPEQKTKTSRSKLVEMGFNFNYFTSIYTTKSGTVYYFVYNQGYLPLEGDYFALVKRDN